MLLTRVIVSKQANKETTKNKNQEQKNKLMLIPCLKDSVYSIVFKIKSETPSIAFKPLNSLEVTMWLDFYLVTPLLTNLTL